MPVTYNFKKGADLPVWLWLNQFFSGNSDPGTSCQYDGTRYLYWVIQFGTTTAGTASTTQLWRFDTWTDGWQFLATATSGSQGLDIEYDPNRNVLYIITGAALTSWQVFNLNTASVNIAGTTCNSWVLTTMAPILPAASSVGGSITQPSWMGVPSTIDTETVASGSTASVIQVAGNVFMFGQVGLEITMTSGVLNGQSGVITSQTSSSATISPALSGAPAAGDTFTVNLPTGTATGAQTTTTLQDTTQSWTTNQYSNSDVVITSGTGSGQRRRVASNTGAILTLAAAVTGNSNTGVWTTTPDATSVYQIQPSADFLYYQNGNTTATFYKLDLTQTTGAAWVTLTSVPATVAGGGNTVYPDESAPFSILCVRGNGTGSIYYYNIGTNAWATPTVFVGGATFTTGSSSCLLHGLKKLFLSASGSQVNYLLDLSTGILEPFPSSPYAAPSAYDGKRAHYVKTADGAQFLYLLRAGGQEFWRIPIEWL